MHVDCLLFKSNELFVLKLTCALPSVCQKSRVQASFSTLNKFGMNKIKPYPADL